MNDLGKLWGKFRRFWGNKSALFQKKCLTFEMVLETLNCEMILENFGKDLKGSGFTSALKCETLMDLTYAQVVARCLFFLSAFVYFLFVVDGRPGGVGGLEAYEKSSPSVLCIKKFTYASK